MLVWYNMYVKGRGHEADGGVVGRLAGKVGRPPSRLFESVEWNAASLKRGLVGKTEGHCSEKGRDRQKEKAQAQRRR